MKLQPNFIMDSDAYKIPHWLMYRKGLENIGNYGECRTGAFFDESIFLGAQKILMDNFEGHVIDKYKIDEAEQASAAHFGTKRYFNREMFEYIVNKYGGMLPIEIKAVKEGTKVPTSNVLFNTETLDKKCSQLVQHGETLFMHFWYPTTLCTNDFYLKQDIYGYLKISGTPENIEFMAHNFGFRSVTCRDQAAIGSLAWLANFRGDDTIIGDRAAKFYYGFKEDSILKSVMASEHSVALQYGPGEGEYDYAKACLDAADIDKPVSIVIDTYDANNFIDNVLTREDVKSKILLRETSGGKVVPRQDSGDWVENTNRNLDSLASNFGFSHNKKHYKVLPPYLTLLQGDAMTRKNVNILYPSIMQNKWSADNLIVAGGSGFMQKDFERDTQRVAIKPSFINIDGVEINVNKEVKGQPDKASKPGRLKLHQSGNDFMTISSANESPQAFNSYSDSLQTIFKMGECVNKQSFDEIRARIASYLK